MNTKQPNGKVNLSSVGKQRAKKDAARQKFIRLCQEWKSRKSHSSCVEEAILHPAYLRMIGMGSEAIPLIMAELEKKTDHWFTALFAITEAEPVPEEHQGNMQQMVEAWIKWAKTRGYRS